MKYPAGIRLSGLVAITLLLSACAQSSATLALSTATPAPTDPAEATQAPATPIPTQPATSQPTEVELDLRFANVTQVEFEQLSENEFRFDVTLYHDDDGEAPNFADAWQVLDPEGNVLGERELLHSHGTQPFTRSERINIPEEVDTVIIRGHDMTHGFGGQGMRVDLTTGETTIVQIDSGS